MRTLNIPERGYLVPIQYALRDQHAAAVGSAIVERAGETDDASVASAAPKTGSASEEGYKTSIALILGLMTDPFTTGPTFCNAISALGSITFVCITTVASRVGLTWNHFRDLLGSSISVTQQSLLRQWLYCDLTSDGQAPCWLVKAACLLVSKLTNVSWSSDSMRFPRSNLNSMLTVGERNRLGPVNATSFAAVEHLGEWLDYLVIIPDSFHVTRLDARGTLADTLTEEKEGVNEFVFRARSFYTTAEWKEICHATGSHSATSSRGKPLY